MPFNDHTHKLHPLLQAKYKSNINNLYGQYESTRNQMEKEEKRQMQQMGLNPQEKVFSAEEVSEWRGGARGVVHLYYVLQMAGKLMGDRRKFQLGVCEVRDRDRDKEGRERERERISKRKL